MMFLLFKLHHCRIAYTFATHLLQDMKQNRFFRPSGTHRAESRVRHFKVKEENTLLSFLFSVLSGQSRTSVKSLLGNRQVLVNGKVTSRFDEPLSLGDTVEISSVRGKIEFRHPMLRIVWEDPYLIVVEKKSGLLSMATQKEKERTAYHLLSEYVKKTDECNRIFILHRLDKDTSGLMMFAKDRMTQNKLQSNWNDAVTERTYTAVVEGRPEKDSGLISNFLSENAGLKVYVASSGSEAITRYRLLKSNEKYSMLELNLETGRKNQIRAHMESIGHPIAGDRKYGAESDPAGRMALHATTLSFIHPVTNEELHFNSAVPSVFHALVKKS